jgi:hypothetical protein
MTSGRSSAAEGRLAAAAAAAAGSGRVAKELLSFGRVEGGAGDGGGVVG